MDFGCEEWNGGCLDLYFTGQVTVEVRPGRDDSMTRSDSLRARRNGN